MILELESTKNLPLSPMNNPPRGLRAKTNLLHDSDFGFGNKKEIKIMATAINYGNLHEKVGSVEYKMPVKMAQALIKSRKGEDAKMRPKDYLVKVVNEDFGLLHHCDNVITY